MKKLLIIIVIAVAIAAGIYFYKGGKIDGLTGGALPSDNPVLEYVPADTVLFAGSVEPMEFTKALEMSTKMGFDTSAMMGSGFEEIQADIENAPDAARMLVSLYGKYLSAVKAKSIKELGFRNELNMAFYTVGALPVIRFELDGTDAFTKALENIETDQNVKPTVNTVNGVEYREYSMNDGAEEVPFQLIIASHDNQAIITVNTLLDDAKDLQVTLSEKPTTNILDGGALNEVASDNGYLGYSIFMLDNLAIVDGITKPTANSFGKGLQDLMGAYGAANEMADIQTEACNTELTGLTKNWPLLSAGYTEFDDSNASYKMVLKGTNLELMDTLGKLRGHISNNISNQDYVMSFGLGLDMDQIVPVITTVWEGLTKEDFSCPPLAEMQAGLRQSNPMMLGMMSGMVAGIKGAGFSVVEMDESALSNVDSNPMAFMQNSQVMVTITAEKPQNLLQSLGMYAPELAQLKLEDGGEPQTLPMGMGSETKIALRGHDLIMMMGNTDALAGKLTSNDSMEKNGLMSFTMDFKKYMSLMEQAMASAAEEANGESKTMLEEQKEVFAELKKADGTIKGTFDIKDSGIVTESKFHAK
ncbi:hypothetical protein [Kangiella sediminilitoris]|uniref:DUF4836 family protein n=1 Tax=Kangiella sediminilitoris TaxID=1144748 RepID=A0A1B3BB02_9GAMM|nr:hypothetical protein [Kangiella sediminilitoris]AOE49944.1 hypothetical protein KS2013_1225 [Kangiella sediminilitoris]